MQVKDISDAEVIEVVNAYWAQIPKNAWANPLYKYPPSPYTVLSTRYPPKVVLRKLEKMIDKRILECGTTPAVPWIRST